MDGYGEWSFILCDFQIEKIEAYHNVMEEKHVCSFKNIARIGSMLYLGTMGQGIISFDTQTKEFARFVDVGCNVISSLSGDGKSLLYVGTDGNGVHFVSTDKKKVVRSMRHETGKDETLRSNSVYSVLVDKEGLILGRILSAGVGLHIISEWAVLHLYVCSFFLIPEICQYVHLLSKRKRN